MLRKFLISTVIVSILILLTNFTSITEAASVATLTSSTTRSATKTTPLPLAAIVTTTAPTSNTSATVSQLTKASSSVNKFLNNAAEETTTSLLPLQPPLNVTSTTLASFILNQKHQQQQRQRKRQQELYLRQQRQHRQLHDFGETQEQQQKQHEQQQQQPQLQEYLLNDSVNGNKEIKKKNLDSSFVTLKSAIDVTSSEPSSTHAYIPFDLDYSDPTEEKAAQAVNVRQSTINEVLTNLFPKGFSDIFRFSYAAEEESTTPAVPSIIPVRSTPTPFKPMPSSTGDTKKKTANNPRNATLVSVSSTVTREMRREISPGHMEIVVEKIITDPSAKKSNEDFKDGSNSITKDELLRINRAAKEASVLPSLLINPASNARDHFNKTRNHEPIVILNENNGNDDFVDAPEDDNHIAESQDVPHQVVQPPPAESTNYHTTATHQYNVHIIHDNNSKNDLATAANKHDISLISDQKKDQGNSAPSYQSFIQQSEHLQNSLQESPSRRFLKNFQNPILSESSNTYPVAKGNFHYEQSGQQNHIQPVAPTTQLQYLQYQQEQPQIETYGKGLVEHQGYQKLHTQISDSQHLNVKDIYQIDSDHVELEHTTPTTLVFVTINSPISQDPVLQADTDQEPHMIPAQHIKSPHEFVSNAMGYSAHDQKPADHQAQQTEDQPKHGDGGYTFVEVQKSINIHNKLITEKDGRLVEQHETIYPEQNYANEGEQLHALKQEQEHEQTHPSPDYVLLSQNPIHVEQLEEQYEPAASVREEQHALNPAQNLEEFDPIQQSTLVQESHIIETPQQLQADQEQHYEEPKQQHQEIYVATQDEQKVQEEQQVVDEHHYLTGEILPSQSTNVAPTAAAQVAYNSPAEQVYQAPSTVVVQEVVEKHIPVPYGVPQPVGIPMHIQHFVDRPFPVETIVEKPVPYPVEKVVEKVVEKQVPVEVEKIVEKPVEVVVNKYIDRPVAIPIKIPVALHLPPPQHGPPTFGSPNFAGGIDHASPWPQSVGGGNFAHIPQNILKAYYVKMLKKLVPQMQQAYKSANSGKGVPKITQQKSHMKPKYRISDILYDLKPPPPRPKSGSNWDVSSRYQYDYNTLPIDLSASSSIAVAKNVDRPGQGYKANFDEFQRWRNGHSLKRSPDFGRNLHMEYGFKPPLIPSIEIDDKGIPLNSVADSTNGKQK